MDAYGHVTGETLGNNISTSRTFDAVTSWLTKSTAGVSGGSGVLNQSYAQDENGNIKQRQDNNNRSLTENFFYDADNRLVCATLSSSCSTNTFKYDLNTVGPGNLTYQAGVGTYNYNAAGGTIPHAVRSITGTLLGVSNPDFSYDANGNMTARASTTPNITWFSSNYPNSISTTDATGSETVQFNYGPDRQRWKQLYTAPGTTETTYYVGSGMLPSPGQLEVVMNGTTNYRHYIYAGSKPIAIYNRSSSNTISYILAEHQGGVSAITSNAGTTNVSESYSAFGALRNSATWSGSPSPTDLTFSNYSRQGYTFQTALGQSMGLNHMNGRVEDALLGRVISPDPILQDPSNAQNYNPYTYALNNPVSLVDPTGFEHLYNSDDDDDDDDSNSAGSNVYSGINTDPNANNGNGCTINNPCLPDVGCGLQGEPECPAWKEVFLPPEPLILISPYIPSGGGGGGTAVKGAQSQFSIFRGKPPGAIACTAYGTSFLAPPSFDIGKITAAGQAGGWSPSAINSAVGHYGSFDFQRSTDAAGNTTFYTQYQVASNVAVGSYLYGTGIPEILSNAIEDIFAVSMSSNSGDSNQFLGQEAGWDAASGQPSISCSGTSP